MKDTKPVFRLGILSVLHQPPPPCPSSSPLLPKIPELSQFCERQLIIQLIGKDPDAGKDGGWEEKGATEDEMVGWHHRPNGREFEQTPGHRGQGSLVCCRPWGRKVSDTTEWLSKQQLIIRRCWCTSYCEFAP